MFLSSIRSSSSASWIPTFCVHKGGKQRSNGTQWLWNISKQWWPCFWPYMWETSFCPGLETGTCAWSDIFSQQFMLNYWFFLTSRLFYVCFPFFNYGKKCSTDEALRYIKQYNTFVDWLLHLKNRVHNHFVQLILSPSSIWAIFWSFVRRSKYPQFQPWHFICLFLFVFLFQICLVCLYILRHFQITTPCGLRRRST